MATLTDNTNQIRKEFRNVAGSFNQLKRNYFRNKSFFRLIYVGMSGDFKIIIIGEEGCTIIRIGSLIFREQN
jgi:uncharacterized pyridoxal phosphate-containing UPF0001 family protein